MIQQIYITDYLSGAAAQPVAQVESLLNQCPSLQYASWQTVAQPPLNALFTQLVAPDSRAPHAPVSRVLSSRVEETVLPAFCLLPVHLAMRRDTFSLQSIVPLSSAIYQALTTRLQAHFAADFELHIDAGQRYWWVQPLRQVQAQCRWPQDCLFQQAMHWQPQGSDAGLIRQWANEMQMLLHQLATEPSMADWPGALNSLWFASVDPVPNWQHRFDLVAGQGEIFAGLSALQLPRCKATTLAEVMQLPRTQQALWITDELETLDWPALNQALQAGTLQALHIVIPFAERSVQIHYQKRPRWQFWRKPTTLNKLLQQLEQSLSSATEQAGFNP